MPPERLGSWTAIVKTSPVVLAPPIETSSSEFVFGIGLSEIIVL